MADYREAFVGIDVAKLRNAIAIADGGREGEVRFLGEVDASHASMSRLIQRIAAKVDCTHFCYEAGPTGYGLYRLIRSLGHECIVVAPSLIPRRPGDRVKTNRRDALSLARLLRAGELTAVWVPDEGHEAMRDLVRARAAAVETLRVHRQQVSAFMLKHGRVLMHRAAAMTGEIAWPLSGSRTGPVLNAPEDESLFAGFSALRHAPSSRSRFEKLPLYPRCFTSWKRCRPQRFPSFQHWARNFSKYQAPVHYWDTEIR